MNKNYNVFCDIFDYVIKNYRLKKKIVCLVYMCISKKQDKIIKDEDKC